MHEVTPSPCPYCKYADATHASMLETDEAPTPGDFVICLRCANLCAFDDNLILRTPTEGELLKVAGDPGLRRTMFLVGAHRAYVAATEEEVQAVLRTAKELGGICGLTELATALEWEHHKLFGVMKKLEDRGLGFALPGKGMQL